MNSIATVGLHLNYNAPLFDYIYRESLKHLKSVDNISLNIRSDKNLFIRLQNIIEESQSLIIYTKKCEFSIVAKLLATINSDKLELKDEMLLPSKANLYSEKSFYLEIENCAISVVLVDDEESELGEILIDRDLKSAVLNIFDIDVKSIEILLSSIAQSCGVEMRVLAFIDGWSRVVLEGKEYNSIKSFIAQSKRLLPSKVIASSNIITFLIEYLYDKNQKLTFAESCTGGRLCSLFTSVAGASHIFDGSVISYANHIKECWLEVCSDSLSRYGAVSEVVVSSMLDGALKLSGADFALATSGIAGPSGESEQKSVGLVFVGFASRCGARRIERLNLKGDRNYIQDISSYYAIKLLIDHIKEHL